MHRKEREVGRGEGTVKLKQMPEKEPPYVLVLIISTFVGTTTTCASLLGFLYIYREGDGFPIFINLIWNETII